MVMAIALESTKVVTAVWLHLQWKELSRPVKSYLTFAVLILMAITSMGIFGFLSKAHIENQMKIDVSVGEQMKLVDLKIDTKEAEIADVDKQLKAKDDAATKTVELSTKSSDARRALEAVQGGSGSRKTLVKERTALATELSGFRVEKIKLQSELSKLEADVGPIKYIADLFYGHADKAQLERSVTWLIMLLVICFDPLAIMLLIGTNVRFKSNVDIEPHYSMPDIVSSFVQAPIEQVRLNPPRKLIAKSVSEPKEVPQVKSEEPPKRVRRRVAKKVVWGPEHTAPVSNVIHIDPKHIKKTGRGRPKKGYLRIPDKAILKFK